MRIGYFTNMYPSISHTFIRREINGLEELGHTVLRYSVRSAASKVVDPADIRESQATFQCLEQPKWSLLLATALAACGSPLRFARAAAMSLAMARRAGGGAVRPLAYLAEAALLRRRLKADGVRHIHVHFGTNPAAVARLLKALGGPTYSLTIHGPEEFDAPVPLSIPQKVMDAEFVAAISDFGAAQVKRWIPPEQWPKVHVVRCTVGGEFLVAPEPIGGEARELLCIGRLSAQKGQFVLVDAFARLIESGLDARLVLAGDGELRPEIEKWIADRRLQDRVTITGWVNESQIRGHLRRARALVLPSFAEGLPVVIMEALAAGRPVISTYVAGIPELVRPGVNGWLVTAGRADQLADAMREALEAPPERLNDMGSKGRALVAERHRTGIEAKKLERLFAAVMDQPSERQVG